MTVYVALLRGINLGARNKVPMAGLSDVFASVGLDDVTTYVQSGNVVFGSRDAKTGDLAETLEQRIADELGVRAAVLLRTLPQLRRVVDGNPFLGDEEEPTKLLAVFLDRAPTAEATRKLDPARSPPDRFSVQGSEIYLHVPNGFGRSKLTLDYFERGLGVKGTARNWRTVTKLLELAEARGERLRGDD